MTAVATPRFLDTFQPRRLQASGVAAPGGDHLSILKSEPQRPREQRKAKEQVQHYKYWNYVGIRAVANFFAGTFPSAGYPVRSQAGRQQRLSKSEHKWIRQRYGPRWLQTHAMDLDPLPDTHPVLELLHRVNGEDTWHEFAYETCVMLYLTGRFFWLIVPNGMGMPAELWVIPTQWMYRHRTKRDWWELRPDHGVAIRELPPEEVLTGKFKSPISKDHGWGPLDAGPMWVDNVESIETSRRSTFGQGVNPDVLLHFEGDQYQNPAPGLLERIMEKFLARNASVENAGKPMMIPPGVKAEKWSHKPREMDYANTGNQVRDNNLALIGTPKTVAGITDDVNRATVEGSLVAFCAFTMNPLFRWFAGVLTEKLAPLFDPRIRFWYPDCTPEDAEFQLKRDESHFRMGAFDPDEARQAAGREPHGTPFYQTGYLPTGLTPLNEDLQPEDEPEPPANEPPPPDNSGDDDEADDEDDE